MTRTTQIQVRLSGEEKAEIQAKAKQQGHTVSEYLRLAALSQPAEASVTPVEKFDAEPAEAPIDRRGEKGPVQRMFEAAREDTE